MYFFILSSIVSSAIINGIDLNKCDEPPEIEFGKGFPGSANGEEFRFRPKNEKTFSGQSTALNPNIIAKFMCDRVNDKCQASQEVKDLCAKASIALASAFKPLEKDKGTEKVGVAADAFNGVFNIGKEAGKDQPQNEDQNNTADSNRGNGENNDGNLENNNKDSQVVTVTITVTAQCKKTQEANANQDQQQSEDKKAEENNLQGSTAAKGDTKDSKKNGPAFAPFDNKIKGDGFTTSSCTQDEQCQTACCDGKKCRAPDALKPGVESCRDGLTPDFKNGLKFVKIK